MPDPKLASIIIPVYNVQKCLDGVLSALLKQTHPCWEAILVDDGSTDDSGAICDEWCRRDSRFRVSHLKNGGVANARNHGLKMATGEFIAFCDSDDYYEPNFLETLFDLQGKSQADLCVASVYVDANGQSKAHSIPLEGDLERSQFSSILTNWFDISWMGLWNKLFKTGILRQHQILFSTGLSLGEDSLFILEYLRHCDRVSCTDIPIYHYVQRNVGSLTHGFNPDTLRGNDLMIAKLLELAKEFQCPIEELQKNCHVRRSQALGTFFYSAMMSGRVGEAQRREIYQMLRESVAEREWLRSHGGFTNKVMASAPYGICRAYFRLLKMFRH